MAAGGLLADVGRQSSAGPSPCDWSEMQVGVEKEAEGKCHLMTSS